MHKNKSLIEDTIILIFISALIYGIYYLFFMDKTQKVEISEQEKQELKVEKEIKETPKKTENVLENIKKAQALIGANTQPKEIQALEDDIKAENKMSVKPIINEEKTETKSNISFSEVPTFYKYLENKIYENIDKNVNKSEFIDSEVKIRITILKNGNYEQPTFMSGNKRYYNAIKKSVLQIFPVQIDEKIKHKFPRYFRMNVK